jgi:Ca2+-binding EF-hand superfamily protein
LFRPEGVGMSSDAKTRKFNNLFDWFDQNQDGYITHDDLQQMTGLFVGLPGGGSPENSQPMREAFEQWWSLLLASGDADADGRIGREEFIRIMTSSVTAPENFEEVVIRIADAFIRIVDTTGDGSLNFNEYVQMYEGLGIDPKHSTESFRILDRNDTGTISHEEFRAAIVEFYLSDDENAPGNWLLGPISGPTKP